ncbi:hypothetical protein LX32DRAFT_202014 [Colletotrichum zoysiae]|uniref:Uncharacterized protein n=1 Tax=Colletotrichum zoysiae TaxID=1216348 RepID=A0AAD9LU99_9PEZI|nr:hypothetical protein LX32DRAFT_202014 [Colletotrichum zoysiae]
MNHRVVRTCSLPRPSSALRLRAAPSHRTSSRRPEFPLVNQITDPALRLSVKKETERWPQGEAQRPSHHINKPHHTFFPVSVQSSFFFPIQSSPIPT